MPVPPFESYKQRLAKPRSVEELRRVWDEEVPEEFKENKELTELVRTRFALLQGTTGEATAVSSEGGEPSPETTTNS